MTHPTRRRAVLLLMSTAALALPACGFRLRQALSFSFQGVRLEGAPATVAAALSKELQAAGVTVWAVGVAVPPNASPPVVLQVMTDQRERIVVGQTATGEVRELQLRHRFRFQLRTAQGRELIDTTELLVERDIGFRETAVLPKQGEEELLYRDMREDLVQQMVRRLAAVRLPG
jgi:LPS-assembly lipoprotein